MVSPAKDKPESTLFKDQVSESRIKKMAQEIGRVYPKFDQSSFVKAVLTKEFSNLELKGRIAAIARGLKEAMPDDFGRTMKIFRKAAPGLKGFENWAIMTYIELYGLEHFDDAVAAMRDLTQYSSAEFAIRPYMNRYTDCMLPILHEWTQHSNEHIRRLAAEGSRPRGVWAAHITAFKKNPRPVLELLEKLKADPSLYVRKAVANNLNDISKDHPDLLIAIAKRWLKDGHEFTDWIIKHACRTLIKKGDPRVMPLFGFTDKPKIKLTGFKPSRKKIAVGSDLIVTGTVQSTASGKQKLVIDYRIHYVKKAGKISVKVFKYVEKTLGPKESLEVKIKQSFADVSVRTHHPGRHRFELMVNGTMAGGFDFEVVR